MKDLIFVSNLDEITEILDVWKLHIIRLSNSSNSVFYLGLLYIKTMIDIASLKYPHIEIEFICNCNDDPALAYNAMKMGFKYIYFSGDKIMTDKLISIATKTNCKIVDFQ